MKNFKNNHPQKILITGASSGIGKALALFYAAQKLNQRLNELSEASFEVPIEKTTLFLCGRNLERLQLVQKQCQEFGAEAHIFEFDVKNQEKCRQIIENIFEQHEIDLLIANAGISAGTLGGCENIAQIKEIFSVNFDGVINVIDPAISKVVNRFKSQRDADLVKNLPAEQIKEPKKYQLQIAIISSLAGFCGLPSSPAYSASKAAVRVLGEALRGNLKKYGIAVNVICPGYVKTPMTAVNQFFMPGIVEPNVAAKKIADGLSKNKARITFPNFLYLVIWLLMLLPSGFISSLLAKLPGKKALE